MSAKENAYSKAFKKHKGSIKSLMWNSYASAVIRYREITKDINFNDKTILDVGCGFGDIIPFIAAKSTVFQYTGIDLTKEFIEEAKKRYPDYSFMAENYFKRPFPKKFDIILCSGALNGNYGKGTTETRKQAIKTMFDRCKIAVAFNMAGSMSPTSKKNSIIYYADSMEILKYCATLSKRLILRNHYHPRDFTIIIFKK
ncbi:MAG: hypothetical protein A3J76_02405 [Candidatus Moranbacteria bacterium RBG_13_45_13]|nr:MAG: hypothetical protein A3J76_02405 [Candidatus Moranbacteria bacterium RBG_13_45_13]